MMKVSWTPTARFGYFRVIAYLEKTWAKREVQNFIDIVEKVINQIKADPYMFEASRMKKNVRKGFITKHNTLYYRIKPRKKEIELLVFWDNRKDTKKLTY